MVYLVGGPGEGREVQREIVYGSGGAWWPCCGCSPLPSAGEENGRSGEASAWPTPTTSGRGRRRYLGRHTTGSLQSHRTGAIFSKSCLLLRQASCSRGTALPSRPDG